jgi:hypothetical protein
VDLKHDTQSHLAEQFGGKRDCQLIITTDNSNQNVYCILILSLNYKNAHELVAIDDFLQIRKLLKNKCCKMIFLSQDLFTELYCIPKILDKMSAKLVFFQVVM